MRDNSILEVAVPVPLRQTFEFMVPQCSTENDLPAIVGARVKVPFGRRKLIGVITAVKNTSNYPQNKLKEAYEILDSSALFEPHLWATLQWISRYYLAAIGEVVETAMPVLLRQGSDVMPQTKRTWRLSEYGRHSPIEDLNRAPLQLAIIKRFMRDAFLSSGDFKADSSGWRQAVKTLVDKGWLEEFTAQPSLDARSVEVLSKPDITLTHEQNIAVNELTAAVTANVFSCSLLHGVTGSGKTEVYFATMQMVLNLGKQVLLLVPEIGLTPQLISRIEQRFSCSMVVLHSGLNDTERHLAWWHAFKGNAHIVVGTRSAVFANFAHLGLIIVDEEHDGSFKQQDGVRYQARDVAIYRAKQHNIPILLGSATPSLESFHNASQARYQLLTLTQRATNVQLPKIEMIDLNRQPSHDGLSPAMLEAISATLNGGKQVMLFLNRRGYAPVLYCKNCQTACRCHRCDSNMTVHRRANRMRCHHCGYEGAIQSSCESCNSDELIEVGEGTQRVEEALALRFPQARLLRIDRDSTSRKGELESLLKQAEEGNVDILLGTKLIAKGHDFPKVSMVGILDVDSGLHSSDFRASEMLFQQILQVAGRAGRRQEPGHVYIQTYFEQHPFFDWVIRHDFNGFVKTLLADRRAANYPPFGYFAMLRAESTHQAKALQFLRYAKYTIQPVEGVQVMDAISAPMERKAGKYRAQLLITSQQRSSLNATLVSWLNYMAEDKDARKLSSSVRWSLDIDPLDHY